MCPQHLLPVVPPDIAKGFVTSKQFLWSSFALSSRVDWCSCERRKLLVAARHVVLVLNARCRAVEVLLACSIPLFLIEFVFARNLFVTAWSWYGRFSKSLFSSNLWLVVYRLAVLYRLIDWPCFIGIYPWTYHCKVIQQLSGTGRKFSETGLFWVPGYVSRNQDLLLGATDAASRTYTYILSTV